MHMAFVRRRFRRYQRSRGLGGSWTIGKSGGVAVETREGWDAHPSPTSPPTNASPWAEDAAMATPTQTHSPYMAKGGPPQAPSSLNNSSFEIAPFAVNQAQVRPPS